MASLSPPSAKPTISRDVRVLVGTAALLLVIIVAAFIAVLTLAASAVNAVQARQEQSLVEKMLDRTTAKISSDLTTATVWDQAYREFHPGGKRTWADAEMGSFFVNNRGVDVAYAVDPDDRPFYAYTAAGYADPSTLNDFGRATAGMLATMRREAPEHQRRLSSHAAPTAPELAQTLAGT